MEFCSYKVWFNKKNCNCSYRKSYYIIKISFRNSSTITCGCGWAVRFRNVHRDKYEVSDPVVITSVCGTHYNTCDPSYAKQFVFGWTRSSDYKKCTNVVLKEIMIQMDITPFIDVRVMRELLCNILPDRNFIDKHMITNVRIRTRKR